MFRISQDTATAEGGYTFTCQHGPDECVGNEMLACAKKYITVQKDYVDFNICVMTAEDPPFAGEAVSTFQKQLKISRQLTCFRGKFMYQNLSIKIQNIHGKNRKTRKIDF